MVNFLATLFLQVGALDTSLSLETPFQVSGRLQVVRRDEGGLPNLVTSKLYLRRGRTMRRILALGDLEGSVRIDSESEALAFARLRTSPVTGKALSAPLVYEVVERPDVDPAYLFGQSRYLEDTISKDGMHGVVEPGWLSRSGLLPTAVSRSPSGFTVRRNLVVWEDEFRYGLVRSTESVGRNGRYRMVQKQRTEPRDIGAFRFRRPLRL
jgi:hypothetical protein